MTKDTLFYISDLVQQCLAS